MFKPWQEEQAHLLETEKRGEELRRLERRKVGRREERKVERVDRMKDGGCSNPNIKSNNNFDRDVEERSCCICRGKTEEKENKTGLGKRRREVGRYIE